MASSTIKMKAATSSMFVIESYSFTTAGDTQTHSKEGYFPICPCSMYTSGGRTAPQVDIWNPSIGQVSFRVMTTAAGAIAVLWCKCS